MKAQNERRAGQIPAAIASLENALRLDPKAPGANMLRAQLLSDQGKVDEAVASVKADVAADATNKERDAQFLLSLGNSAYRAAVTSKKPDDYKKALALLQASESINPSPQAKFISAVSAYQLFAPIAQDLARSKSCTDARAASGYLDVVSTNMPGGGSVDAATAQQILGAVPQSKAYVDAQVKRLCK
jgi:tetratricopeptide (TPR) repeat protein